MAKKKKSKNDVIKSKYYTKHEEKILISRTKCKKIKKMKKKTKILNKFIITKEIKMLNNFYQNFNIKDNLQNSYAYFVFKYVNKYSDSKNKFKLMDDCNEFGLKVKCYFEEINKVKYNPYKIFAKRFPKTSILIEERLEEDLRIKDESPPGIRKLSEKYGVSYSTIRNYLKNIMGMKYKTLNSLNHKADNRLIEYDIAIFIDNYIKLQKDDCIFIWIDESNMNSNKRSKKNWLFNNETNIIHVPDNNMRYNLIVSATSSEILYYEIHEATANSFVYYNFLWNLESIIILREDLKKKYFEEKIFIVQDNCRIHLSNEIKFKTNVLFFQYLFISPYCPYFNVIELIFRNIKANFYKEFFYSK